MEELEKKYDSIIMVERALNVIKMLSDAEGSAGVSEIAENLNLPKANVYRILNTLNKSGFAIKDPENDKYDLSIAFIEIGEKLKYRMDIEKISSGVMKELSEKLGETVNLGIFYEDEVLTIHSIQGESSILVSKLKATAPLYCSSSGKLYLSEMKADEAEDYFNREKIVKRTINTITNYEMFLKEKALILKEKIAYDREEFEYGLTCISCPVIGKNGEIKATLGISGPTSRLVYKDFNCLAEEIKTAAKDLSVIVQRANIL